MGKTRDLFMKIRDSKGTYHAKMGLIKDRNGRDLTEAEDIKKWSEVKLLSRVQLFATPWTVAYQASPSMGFSRQEYWSGLPFPSPEDLPNPGTEHRSASQAHFLPFELQGIPDIYAEYIIWNAGVDEAQAGIKIARISITSDMQIIPPLWQKVKN